MTIVSCVQMCIFDLLVVTYLKTLEYASWGSLAITAKLNHQPVHVGGPGVRWVSGQWPRDSELKGGSKLNSIFRQDF